MSTARHRHSVALIAALLVNQACASLLYEPLLVPEQPQRPADAIVVLGIRPGLRADGSVNPELARRMARGLALYDAGLAPKLLVTGGSIQPTEAAVMSRIALAHGVPRSAIVFEPYAADTIENARRSVGLLCRPDRKRRCKPSVLLVTSGFHMARSQALFECAGAEVQPAASKPGPEPGYRTFWGLFEAAVRVRYAFDDPCAHAALPSSRFDLMTRERRFDALDW